MGLSGTFSTFPLADLLQWLSSARKTGTLVVQGDRYRKLIYVKAGRIISSASDDPTEQLGQYLLSHGCITEDQLRKGLETQARTRVLLGKILLMVGSIREEILRQMLVTKAEETIFTLFLWTDASFEFLDRELPTEVFIPINLDVQDVLLRGLTLVDELGHYRAELGSARSILARTPKALPAGFPPAGSPARVALALVDGRRTIADICLALHASEFKVCGLLYPFIEEGFLILASKVEPSRGTRADSPPFVDLDLLVARARERLETGDAERAVEILDQAATAAPRSIEIRKLLDRASAAFRETVYANHLPPDRVPVLTRPFDQLTGEWLTPEEGFLLSRIDGAWDLRSIIGISPLGEVEALRILKRLKDRGIIAIR